MGDFLRDVLLHLSSRLFNVISSAVLFKLCVCSCFVVLQGVICVMTLYRRRSCGDDTFCLNPKPHPARSCSKRPAEAGA